MSKVIRTSPNFQLTLLVSRCAQTTSSGILRVGFAYPQNKKTFRSLAIQRRVKIQVYFSTVIA